MAKYFLGSVGKAEAFRVVKDSTGTNDILELAFVSKTLTDSGLNIQTTKDDIRAGEGAPIQFSFYHDTTVEITLTDVVWKPEYVSAQLGAQFKHGTDTDGTNHSVDYVTESVTVATAGTIEITGTVLPMPVACVKNAIYTVWYAKSGTDDWKSFSDDAAITSITDADAKKDDVYCVRYLAENAAAQSAEILSTIIPEELFLIITAPLYAGDACAASKGKAAGHITYEVPRFQLNGAQEFAMNMSQNQTMSLAGIALAGVSEDCESNAGKLLRIIEVVTDRTFPAASSIVDIVVDDN